MRQDVHGLLEALIFDINEFDDHKPEVKRESHANKMKFNLTHGQFNKCFIRAVQGMTGGALF